MSTIGSQHERTPQVARMKSDTAVETPTRWHVNGLRTLDPASPQNDTSLLSESSEPADGQWDSTIGKAGLGKTGRVINKLVSDNDALKREIKIEQLKAEEAKQAARLVEDKMERMINDYESRLLEANVTKTLLARKERQVETLSATVESEKKRTTEALQREKSWREELDKIRKDTEVQVDEATSYAQLMEGRYNAISSHWRDQGDQVKRAVSGMKDEIDTLNEERRSDDDKIQTLRDLCDQQDSNIQQLRREKEDIARKFEDYKQAQEDGLRDIKTNAARREVEQERILEESREALNKLRWALKVKENVKGAQ
jgi:chromosome segregation ATPase